MSLIDTTTLKPSVDPDETVAGQMQKVMDSSSPLLQKARTQAAQAANKRGLSNTTMAVQAGEQAVLNTALPIAQQDAATHATRGNMNQQFQQQVGGGQYGTGLIGANLAAQQTLGQDQQTRTQANMNLQQQLDLGKLDRQVYANTRGSYMNAINEIIRQSNISVGNLQVAPDISSADKARMLEDQGKLLETHIKLYKNIYESATTWTQGWVNFPQVA